MDEHEQAKVNCEAIVEAMLQGLRDAGMDCGVWQSEWHPSPPATPIRGIYERVTARPQPSAAFDAAFLRTLKIVPLDETR